MFYQSFGKNLKLKIEPDYAWLYAHSKEILEFFEKVGLIIGKKSDNKWMRLIGFSNPKHITKIEVWKKLGYCPPRTTYLERLKILKEG